MREENIKNEENEEIDENTSLFKKRKNTKKIKKKKSKKIKFNIKYILTIITVVIIFIVMMLLFIKDKTLQNEDNTVNFEFDQDLKSNKNKEKEINVNEKTLVIKNKQKPVKKVKFVDFYGGFKDNDNGFYNLLITKYNIILSEDPDYVIYDMFGGRHLQYNNAIKIFTTCESRDPNFNLCDYALSYYPNIKGDRNIYYHLSGKFFNVKEKREYKPNKKFCSFLVSNSVCSMRNDFFVKLSEYKKVDSGGKYKNNIGYRVERGKETNYFLSKYKFNICFENIDKYGYTTEKIFNAFEAGTIPIYWGDPSILKFINPKSFIYIGGREDFDKAINLIKKIDQDDELYKSYLNEKVFLDDNYIEKEIKKFKNFWFHIFDQDIECARRRNPVDSEKCRKQQQDYDY